MHDSRNHSGQDIISCSGVLNNHKFLGRNAPVGGTFWTAKFCLQLISKWIEECVRIIGFNGESRHFKQFTSTLKPLLPRIPQCKI